MAAPDGPVLSWLLRHPLAAFAGLVLGFALFAAVTLDLARVLLANLDFIAAHGWDAVREAALWQLAGLLLKLGLGLLGYLGFKVCEHALVQRILRGP